MDVDRTAVEVALVAWDERASASLDQLRLDVPSGLDPDGVRWYVEHRFGTPVGTVGSGVDPGSSLGWTYPITVVPELAGAHPSALLLVVPFGRGPEGDLRELPIGSPPLAQDRPRLRVHDRAGITAQVGGWLQRMLAEGDTYLLLEVGDRHRYVQFATHDGRWLRGEVVGPVQVPDHPLTPAELAAIRDVGWNDPHGGAGGGNFWFEWGDPDTGEAVDLDDAAELAAATLCVAFAPLDPAGVRVETGPSLPGRSH